MTRTSASERSLTPTKAGHIYGKFTPSPTKEKIVEDEARPGKLKVVRLNRRQRRHGDF